MARERTRLAVAVVASVALHTVSTVVAPPRPGPPRSEPPPPMALEFEVAAGEPSVAVAPSAPRKTPSARPTPRAVAPTPVVPAAVEASVAAVEAPEEGVVVAPAHPQPLDLSPLAAARTLVDVREAPDASCAAPEAPAAPDAAPPGDEVEASLAAHVPGLVRSNAEPARHAVERTVQSALQPWNWRRRAPGRYRYQGRGFEATILDDGSVALHDKDGVSLTPAIPFVTREGERTMRAGFGVAVPRFDRLIPGNTADAAERREFMARTHALREHLHDQAQARVRTRADLDLARALARLWESAEPLEARKAKLFALWDDCADDEVGDLKRAHVERFVRARCPREAACAFGEGELAMFNATRMSKRPFDPYGQGPSDGGVDLTQVQSSGSDGAR